MGRKLHIHELERRAPLPRNCFLSYAVFPPAAALPILPPRYVLCPARFKNSDINVEVVVFPSLPVMPMIFAGQSSKNSSISGYMGAVLLCAHKPRICRKHARRPEHNFVFNIVRITLAAYKQNAFFASGFLRFLRTRRQLFVIYGDFCPYKIKSSISGRLLTPGRQPRPFARRELKYFSKSSSQDLPAIKYRILL